MAVDYSFEFRTKTDAFPLVIPNKVTYKDADASTASVIKQIETYIMAGNYSAAKSLMDSNASLLQGTFINANDVNRLVEDIRNTQIYARVKKQSIYFDTEEPGYLVHDDVWIAGGNQISV